MSPAIVNSFLGAGGGGGPPTAPADAANLLIWTRSDQGIYTDLAMTTPATSNGDEVKVWADLSGNNNHLVRLGGSSGALLRPSAVNSLNALEFLDSGGRCYVIPSVLAALTSGEVFIVVKSDNDPPTSYAAGQLWVLGNTAPFDTYVTYKDNSHIYECFGSTTQKDCGDPTPSFSSTYRVYNCYSASADWASLIDGAAFFSTGTNTVGWPVPAYLGNGVNTTLTYSGRITEFMIYQHKLSGGDRTTVTAYLGARYGLF